MEQDTLCSGQIASMLRPYFIPHVSLGASLEEFEGSVVAILENRKVPKHGEFSSPSGRFTFDFQPSIERKLKSCGISQNSAFLHRISMALLDAINSSGRDGFHWRRRIIIIEATPGVYTHVYT
ncbi:hypothetical protein [uncultured Xylophilus sp.]|uniref:hypothetical protein n=1 Tax=uncultured Xylophilus sp. TaxID=296832 RepID=UPI0025DE2CAF|nr:hypothetical protein [uncultured Xylophilus sp.]